MNMQVTQILDDLERGVDKEIARYRQYLSLARQAADDPAVHDRLTQAAAALSSAARLVGTAAYPLKPAEQPRWGVGVNYAGAAPARGVLSGPQGR
jgi:hypothetical protein